MKDTKNEVIPQVTKANASVIKKRINSNSESFPLTFEFERTNIKPITYSKVKEVDFYNNSLVSAPWKFNQQRSRFIYHVIHNKFYYLADGNKLKVSDTEIYSTFTKLIYGLTEIESFTHRKEFEQFLFECYLHEVNQEQQEMLNFQNATLLQQLMLHHSTPQLIQESIVKLNDKVKALNSELTDLFNDLKYKRINAHVFEELRVPLDERLVQMREHQQYLFQEYKRLTDSGKYRRRHFLKMAFKTTKRSLEGTFYEPVSCGTLSLCNFYIDEYCRWFNKTFTAEIDNTHKQVKLEKRKQKRQSTKKPNPRLELLKPYLNSDLSYQSISNETGISKTTVMRILKNIA